MFASQAEEKAARAASSDPSGAEAPVKPPFP
jgi:hypothetical protein